MQQPAPPCFASISHVFKVSLLRVQMADEQRVGWLAEQLAAASLDSAPAPPRLRQGQLCAARFSLDQQWYRAKVLSAKTSDPAKHSYDVLFVDFGNKESGLGSAAIRELDAATAAVPAQAFPASLACVQVQGARPAHVWHVPLRSLSCTPSFSEAHCPAVQYA